MSLEIIGRPIKYLFDDQSSFFDSKYYNNDTNGYLESTSFSFGGNDFSIALWFRIDDINQGNVLYNIYDSSKSIDTSVYVDGFDGTLRYSDSSGDVQIDATPLVNGEEYQLILRNNYGLITAYINGVEVLSSYVSDSPDYLEVDYIRFLQGFTPKVAFNTVDEIYTFTGSVDYEYLYNNGVKLNKDFVRTIKGIDNYWQNRTVLNGNIEPLVGAYSLTVNQTLEEQDYSSKGLFQTPNNISLWNAIGGNLPVRYKLESDLYPNNRADTTFSISSAGSYFGDTILTTTANHGYTAGNYVFISDSTNDIYNGVYKIKNTPSLSTFTIGVTYDGTTTGNAIRYYNLYNAVLKVYGGLPDYHVLYNDFPIMEIGEVSISPNDNNIADIDITSIVKTFISTNNDLFSGYAPLDYNAFTAFYIEYAESYQNSNGGLLEVYTSEFEKDNINGCDGDTELFENPDFTSGLTGWDQSGSGESWVSLGNTAQANKSIGSITTTNSLQQSIDLKKGILYTITLDIPNNNNTLFIIEAKRPNSTTTLARISNQGIHKIEFIPPFDDYDTVSIIGIYQSTGKLYDGEAIINEFSLQSSDCTIYLWGSNSVQQFQYYLGGNMGEYTVTPNSISKFLTDFNTTVYFKGKKLTISSIITNDAFTNSYLSDNVYIRLSVDDNYVDRKVKNMNDGLYMIGNQDNEDLFDSMVSEMESLTGGFSNGTIELYSVPANKFIDCSNGTLDNTSDPSGLPPNDWGVTITPWVDSNTREWGDDFQYGSVPSGLPSYSGYGSGVFQLNANDDLLSGVNTLLTFDTPVELSPNSTYNIKFKINNGNRFGRDPRLDKQTIFAVIPDSLPYEVSGEKIPTISLSLDDWIDSGLTEFTTDSNLSFTFRLVSITDNQIDGGSGGAFGIDQIELLGPYEQLTEKQPFRVDENCANQDIHLTWLNSLGGWEYWNFQSIKDYSEDTSGKTIKRDIFNDWDNEFITGTTQNDYSEVTSNRKNIVRSQLLTKDEADAIWNIKSSIRVQQVKDDDSIVTVLVDKGSFTKYQDRDRLYVVEFTITYPDTQIQNQ